MLALLASLSLFSPQANVAGRQDLVGMPAVPWVKEPGVRIDFDAGDPPGTSFTHPFPFAFPDGTYRLYYTIIRPTDNGIVSAVSSDGETWTKEPGFRVAAATIGVQQAHSPSIIPAENGQYRMFFTTWSPGVPFELRSAVSSDGLNWTQEGVRISGANGGVIVPVNSGGWRAYYFPDTIPNSVPRDIVSSFSTDQLSWGPIEPAARVSGAMTVGARRLEDGSTVIFYTLQWQQINTSRSADGLTFTLDSQSVRMVPGNHPTSTQESGSILMTSGALQMPDGKVRVFYSGSADATPLSSSRIFSAVAAVRPAMEALGAVAGWTSPQLALDLDGSDPSGTTGLMLPCVMPMKDATLRMYYAAFPTGNIMSAVSADGLSWIKEAGVRLSSATAGGDLWGPSVVELDSGGYRMYCGTNVVFSAISSDGFSWTPEPGLRHSFAHFPRVIRTAAGTFRMYYWRPGTTEIWSASSSDGLVWSDDAGVRVSGGVVFAVAQHQDDRVFIVFRNIATGHIERAESLDGLAFVVSPSTDFFASSTVSPSSYLQMFDGKVLAYYTESPTADHWNPGRIHVAEAGGSLFTLERKPISAALGGRQRFCINSQGNPGTHYIVLGSSTGVVSYPGVSATLIRDAYYTMTRLGNNSLMVGESGPLGIGGISYGFLSIPAGLFSSGDSLWHACVLSDRPQQQPNLSGKPHGLVGGIAAAASNPARSTFR